MRPIAEIEEIPQFDIKVIGITCLNGVPVGIIFFHSGMMLSANFVGEQVEDVPTVGFSKRTLTTINAPDGMHAVVKGERATREYSKDFRAIRKIEVSYEVVSLHYD